LGRWLLLGTSVVVTVAVLEGMLLVALRHPALWSWSRRAQRLLRALHRDTEWRMVQYEPDCARYDPELS